MRVDFVKLIEYNLNTTNRVTSTNISQRQSNQTPTGAHPIPVPLPSDQSPWAPTVSGTLH